MDRFSLEELNLMCIYDTSNRDALYSDLCTALLDVYEPEMRDIFESTIEKVKNLTDEEFTEISFFITDDFLDETEV